MFHLINSNNLRLLYLLLLNVKEEKYDKEILVKN